MQFETDPRVAEMFDAIERDDADALKALLAQGGDPNGMDYSDGYTPLGYAVELGNQKLVTLMLEAGADADRGGIVSLPLEPLRQGRLDILQLLLEHGANPHHADEEGDTALMWAERNGMTDAIELLRTFDPNGES